MTRFVDPLMNAESFVPSESQQSSFSHSDASTLPCCVPCCVPWNPNAVEETTRAMDASSVSVLVALMPSWVEDVNGGGAHRHRMVPLDNNNSRVPVNSSLQPTERARRFRDEAFGKAKKFEELEPVCFASSIAGVFRNLDSQQDGTQSYASYCGHSTPNHEAALRRSRNQKPFDYRNLAGTMEYHPQHNDSFLPSKQFGNFNVYDPSSGFNRGFDSRIQQNQTAFDDFMGNNFEAGFRKRNNKRRLCRFRLLEDELPESRVTMPTMELYPAMPPMGALLSVFVGNIPQNTSPVSNSRETLSTGVCSSKRASVASSISLLFLF